MHLNFSPLLFFQSSIYSYFLLCLRALALAVCKRLNRFLTMMIINMIRRLKAVTPAVLYVGHLTAPDFIE